MSEATLYGAHYTQGTFNITQQIQLSSTSDRLHCDVAWDAEMLFKAKLPMDVI